MSPLKNPYPSGNTSNIPSIISSSSLFTWYATAFASSNFSTSSSEASYLRRGSSFSSISSSSSSSNSSSTSSNLLLWILFKTSISSSFFNFDIFLILFSFANFFNSNNVKLSKSGIFWSPFYKFFDSNFWDYFIEKNFIFILYHIFWGLWSKIKKILDFLKFSRILIFLIYINSFIW